MGKTFKKLAPVIGSVAGGMVGGPLGAQIGGALGSAVAGRAATKDASNAQQQAYDQSSQLSAEAARKYAEDTAKANQVQKDALVRQNLLYDDQIFRSEPIRHAAHTAQNKLMDVLGLSGNTKAQNYGLGAQRFEDRPFTADPGYQFRLQEGQKALERSAAARGGLFSGRAAKDLTNYGQGAASQEYGNAFNRFQTERQNIINPLETLSGRFQGAVNSQGAAGQIFGNANANYANKVSDNLLGNSRNMQDNATAAGDKAINAGNSRSSSYIGKQNTTNNAFQSGYNAFQDAGGWDKLKNTNIGARARGFFSGVDRSGDEYLRR